MSGRANSDEDLGQAPRRRRGGWQLIIVALATLGGFIAAVWYAYNQGVDDGAPATPPLIRADQSPTKVRPEKPGGLEVPHQDKLVYETLRPEKPGERVERLLPPPEEPIARPEPERQSAPTKVENVKTVPPLPPPPEVKAPSVEAREPPPGPAQAPSVPKPEVAASLKPKAPATSPQAGAIYRIQLASYRNPDGATKGWHRMSTANPKLLGALKPNVVRVDLGSGKGVFYRLQAGPLPDRGSADALCAKLKKQKVGCLVVSP